MRTSIVLIVLALLAVATSSDAFVTTPSAFCTKYTTALYTSGSNTTLQYGLFNAVVSRAAGGCTAGVGAGLSCQNPTGHTADVYPAFVGLFDGASPILAAFAAGPNYVTNATAYAVLADGFTSFFGLALGCSFTPTAPPPTRWTSLISLASLDQPSFSYFNTVLLNSFASFGVEQVDLDEVITPYLKSFGRCSGTREICSVDGCNIASTSRDVSGTTNIQSGCVIREELRLTQIKIDAVIKRATDEYNMVLLPMLAVTSTLFGLIVIVLALAGVAVHRLGGGKNTKFAAVR